MTEQMRKGGGVRDSWCPADARRRRSCRSFLVALVLACIVGQIAWSVTLTSDIVMYLPSVVLVGVNQSTTTTPNHTTTSKNQFSPQESPSKDTTNHQTLAEGSDPTSATSTTGTDDTFIHGKITDPADDEEYFSVCILSMDDNIYWPEWLAYHWQYLPLRRLIVATDPRSKTSPREILDRYSKRSLMNVTIWSDEDYLADHFLQRIKNATDTDKGELVNIYLRRQKLFLWKCLAQFVNENQTWIASFDTDEYVFPNENHYRHPEALTLRPTLTETLSMTIQKNDSSSGILRDLKQKGCAMLPRMRLGDKVDAVGQKNNRSQGGEEEEDADVLPPGFNVTSFSTLNFRYFKGQTMGKSLMYLPWVRNPENAIVNKSEKQAVNAFGAHNMVRRLCSSRDAKFGTFVGSPLSIHHYLGTWEQYSFRSGDVRADIRRRDKFDLEAAGCNLEDNSNRQWLKRFVEQVGEDLANDLLLAVVSSSTSSGG
jgi:hypothetical protein